MIIRWPGYVRKAGNGLRKAGVLIDDTDQAKSMKIRESQNNRFFLLIVFGLLSLLILGGFLLVRTPNPSSPLEIAGERIVPGMSLEQAIEIVGRHPDDSPASSPDVSMDYAAWYDNLNGCDLEIRCKEGRVVLKLVSHRFTVTRPTEPFILRLLRWLKLA